MSTEPGAARRRAAAALDRALATRAPIDRSLRHAARGLQDRDAALVAELVLGTLRWLRRLDRIIAQAADRPAGEIDRRLRAPLRLAAYQLLFLDRVPAYAAVAEAVEEAKRRSHQRAGGFVNAVLRRIAERPRLEEWPVGEGDPVRRLAVESSHPDLLVERWWRNFGEAATRGLVAANNLRPELHLLAFGDLGGRQALARELETEGVRTTPAPLSPAGLLVGAGDPLATRAFASGRFYVQNQASQAAAWIPPPWPGERILDAAVAPGGKSFALMAREPGVRIVAGDRDAGRLWIVRRNLARLDRRLPLAVLDARRPPFTARFDRVVLDLPCSGTGTLRQHPELKWRVSAGEIDRLARQGARLLEGAAPLVRPGGTLVAITCSLEPEENESVVDRFLDRHADFSLPPLEGVCDDCVAPGLWAPGRWRLLTGERNDGFTVQVLARAQDQRRR